MLLNLLMLDINITILFFLKFLIFFFDILLFLMINHHHQHTPLIYIIYHQSHLKMLLHIHIYINVQMNIKFLFHLKYFKFLFFLNYSLLFLSMQKFHLFIVLILDRLFHKNLLLIFLRV